ncbi:MSCRAMM family protein [Enterococcus gallinarum]|uniref:MSCRAMM family protein n=1 Tax=Enterococcus gallinarum TaxID=1353 RepID=UPI003DA451C9
MNYQESAQLVKTDSKENPLPGAKFKLIDKEGKTVIQNLVSDDKGVVLVKNLAPGDYQFIETKAPRGYVLDETPVELTFASKALGEPSLVGVGEFENSSYLIGKRHIYRYFFDVGVRDSKGSKFGNFISYARRCQKKFYQISPLTENLMMEQIKNRRKKLLKKMYKN